MSILWVSARQAQGAITWPPAILTMVSRQPSDRIKCKSCSINTNTRLCSNGLVSLKRDYADLHPIVPSRSGSRTHAASYGNDHIRKCLTPHRLNNHFFAPVLTASERLSKGGEHKDHVQRIEMLWSQPNLLRFSIFSQSSRCSRICSCACKIRFFYQSACVSFSRFS